MNMYVHEVRHARCVCMCVYVCVCVCMCVCARAYVVRVLSILGVLGYVFV
jgi:hypothetical protein